MRRALLALAAVGLVSTTLMTAGIAVADHDGGDAVPFLSIERDLGTADATVETFNVTINRTYFVGDLSEGSARVHTDCPTAQFAVNVENETDARVAGAECAVGARHVSWQTVFDPGEYSITFEAAGSGVVNWSVFGVAQD